MKRAAFTVLALLLPLVLLGVVEGGLRLVGVQATSRTPFVPVPSRPDALALNPDYVARYFPAFVPAVAFTPFAAVKPDAVFRVVALGGSSTAGFPYQFYHGFPARLEARLGAALPALRPEVVNLGLTAVNSYTLWDLRRSVAAMQPDAVVIYAGHNEFYGALGVGSTVESFSDRVALKRLALRLKRTALGAAFDSALRNAGEAASDDRTLMARMVGDATITRDSDAFAAGVAQYATNMEAVLGTLTSLGVPVYLATLTSNLQDQPPLGDTPDARTAYARGRAIFAAGDTVEARAAFLEAKELDPVRFRAPDTLNTLVRTWSEDDAVTLVDVAAAFEATSPTGIEGAALFDDHLHPNAVGYDLIAATFFDALRDHPRLREPLADARTEPVGPRSAPIDPVEAAHVRLQLVQLLSGFPFDQDATPEEAAARFEQALAEAKAGPLADSLAALMLAEGMPMLAGLRHGLDHALAVGDTATALAYFRSALSWQPFNAELMERAVGHALSDPRFDARTLPIARYAATRTDSLYFHNALAAIHVRRGHTARAERFLTYVEERAPDDPTMLYNTARLLLQRGDTTAARGYFARFQQRRTAARPTSTP
ncbi:MAG: GDSL-type esterase/lipase family protein [Bacteroidota bacterium]